MVDSLTLDCGPTCPGPAEVAGLIEYPDIGKPEGCLDEVFFFPCAGTTATFSARIPVRCPDGQIYLFEGTVTAVCLDCDLELDARPAIAPESRVFSDETTTSTAEAEAPHERGAPPRDRSRGAVHEFGADHHGDRARDGGATGAMTLPRIVGRRRGTSIDDSRLIGRRPTRALWRCWWLS